MLEKWSFQTAPLLRFISVLGQCGIYARPTKTEM